MTRLLGREKKYDDTCSRFGTILWYAGQTDGRTEEHHTMASAALCTTSRGKNSPTFPINEAKFPFIATNVTLLNRRNGTNYETHLVIH